MDVGILLTEIERLTAHVRASPSLSNAYVRLAETEIEAQRAGLTSGLSALYGRHRFVGFNTYGEQFREFHVNRNLVGLAIGRGRL